MPKKRRGWLIAAVIVAALILGVVIAASTMDERLRRYAETQANELIPGYRVTIGSLGLHPFTLSVDLQDVVVRQDIHPDPPVVSIPHVIADAQLIPLFSGMVGADLRIETPAFVITRRHVDGFLRRGDQEVIKGEVVAWQNRLREKTEFRAALYLTNGSLTYEEAKPAVEPLRVERIDIEVGDITNRPKEEDEYPSTLRVTAQLLDESHVELGGRADVFAIPLPKVDADLKVQHVQIKHLWPIVERYNVQFRNGTLDLSGRVKYSRQSAVLAIDDLVLEGATIDYVHAAKTKKTEVRHLKKVASKAKELHQDSIIKVKIEHGKIVNSEVGFVNKSTSPEYRVFITEMNVDLDHLSNRFEEGTGVVKVTGLFMGTGRTTLQGTFRPEHPRPDFNLDLKIVKTQVRAFNDVLRAYGDMDTHQGIFAFFSELTVKNNQIHGYVKPLLKDVEVYDPQQDDDKALTKKVYEAVVGGVLGLFENKSSGEVATVTDLFGPVESPQADSWQILAKLVQNAFFKAILPSFEKVG